MDREHGGPTASRWSNTGMGERDSSAHALMYSPLDVTGRSRRSLSWSAARANIYLEYGSITKGNYSKLNATLTVFFRKCIPASTKSLSGVTIYDDIVHPGCSGRPISRGQARSRVDALHGSANAACCTRNHFYVRGCSVAAPVKIVRYLPPSGTLFDL